MEFRDGTSIGRGSSMAINNAIGYLRTENISKASEKYDAVVAATLVANLDNSVKTKQTALLAAVNSSKDEKTALDLGIKATEIGTGYDNLIAAVAQVETDRAAVTGTDQEKAQALSTLIAKIGTADDAANAEGSLYAKLKQLESDAVAANNAKIADDDAQREIATKKDELQTKRDNAPTTISTSYPNASTPDFNTIDEAISALGTTISDAATAQNTVENKSTIEAEITRISGLIDNVITTAQNEQTVYDTDLAAYNKLVKQFDSEESGSLQAQMDAVKTHITEACQNVATDFTTQIEAVQGQINAAKVELEAKHAARALTAESKVDADGTIATAISNLELRADKAQANYELINDGTYGYNAVNTYLTEQRAQAVGAAGSNAGAVSFYRNMFNGEDGFVEQLAAIKSTIDTKASEANNDKPETYKADLLNQLSSLKTEIGKVYPAAQANLTSYNSQMEKYNTVKDEYDAAYTLLTSDTYDQDLQATKDAITSLEAYAHDTDTGNLAQVLATITNNYVIGEATTVETSVKGNLTDYSAEIANVKSNFVNGYADAVATNNSQIYSDNIPAALQSIQNAYVEALAVLTEYQNAQDAGIKAVVDEESTALNNAVYEAPSKKTAFSDRADAALEAANAVPETWDLTDADGDILYAIAAYVAELNQTKTNFLTNVEGAIQTYWNDVKEARQHTITSTFATLTTNGYIVDETAATIFATAYGYIEEGEGYVNVATGEKIELAQLDNLIAGNLAETTFQTAVEAVATDFAQAFVNTKLEPYTEATTGKKDVDKAEIDGIIEDGYDKPATERSIDEKWSDIIAATLTAAEQTEVTFNTAYSTISTLLSNYDTQIAALKATAQTWADNYTTRISATNTLAGHVASAKSELSALQTEIAKTSVAGEYTENINGISTTISGIETKTQNPSIDYTTAQIATDENTIADVRNNRIPTLGTDVAKGVQQKITYNAIVDELKASYNQYAASASADADKVANLNERINAVEAFTQLTTPTLDQAIEIENDIAKLQTELEEANNAEEIAAAIADFETRTAALQNAALPEAADGFGNKETNFTERLEAIKTAGETLAGEVTDHKAAGDIWGYKDNIESRIAAQEEALQTLTDEAEAQAEKVTANKATVEELTTRVDVLINAELTDDYGDMTTSYESRLRTIQSNANTLKSNIQTNADEIQNFKGIYTEKLVALEGQWDTLKEEAEATAEAWAAQKATSNSVYEVLISQYEKLSEKINAAIETVNGYTNSNKSTYYITNCQTQLNNLKSTIDALQQNYSLDETDQENYSSQINDCESTLNERLSQQAYYEARALYVLSGSDLLNAQTAAWNAWKSWSFAASVKTALQEELNGYDKEVSDLRTKITTTDRLNNDCYNNMETYSTTAEDIITEYNAIVERMAAFKPFGDADGNGKVNVLDYQKVVNMILDPTLAPAADSDLFLVTDVNQNEAIEVGDLSGIVNIIMGRDWNGEAAARGAYAINESLTMATSQTQVGTQRIAISLKNVKEYTAFQLDVVLPEGMTIVGKDLTDRAGDSHSLWSRSQQDGSIRFLASSIKGETFSGNSGAVFYIDVETDNSYMGGDVEVLNILFSDANANMRSFTISGGEVTGIGSLSTVENLKQQVYDLGGKIKNGLKKGINIIRRADGTTEKVVK